MTDVLTPPPDSAITPEEWQQTPASVQAWIGDLVAEVKQLRETVEQLQEIVSRNSQNSSQPPSQDRPTRNQRRNHPIHRANVTHNRVIVGTSRCWSMRSMK
jgi:hypothetical protein